MRSEPTFVFPYPLFRIPNSLFPSVPWPRPLKLHEQQHAQSTRRVLCAVASAAAAVEGTCVTSISAESVFGNWQRGEKSPAFGKQVGNDRVS